MVMVPEAVMQRRLTYEDYQALPDDADYEIIEGVLYVAPSPRPRHQVAVNRLAYTLTGHVEERGDGIVVPGSDLIVRSRDTYVAPDIMFFRADRFAGVDLDKAVEIIPDLVVEVISPGSERYDRVTKRDTYAQLGVPHYWLVEPSTRTITEYVLQQGGQYAERTVRAPEMFHSVLFPDLAVDLTRVFA